MLHGLYEFPWTKEKQPLFESDWKEKGKTISHTFTHFHLTLTPLFLIKNDFAQEEGFYVKLEDFKMYPFSTLMKKVIRNLVD